MGRSPARAAAMSATAVPVAFIAANALSYALLLVAAHLMNAADYGTLSSLLGLLLISVIPMLALQTVAARRAAVAAGSAGIARGTLLVGLVSTTGLVLLSPALAVFLHLDNVVGVLLVAATVPLNSLLGTAMGIAQGHRRFRRLSGLILLATGGRSVGGLVGLALGRTPDSTLVGVLVGTALGLVVAAVAEPRSAIRAATFDRGRHGVVIETAKAAYAHGTFLLLTSLDVLLARHVLTSSEAGLYAVGSVVTRTALWLPQAVVALMFASLAEPEGHQRAARRAAGVVAGIGGVLVAGTAALGSLVVTVVGGSKYHGLDQQIWLFAVLGSLLAILQLAVLAGLAQRNARRAILLWITIGADVTVALIMGGNATPTRLVVTFASVTGVAAAVSLRLTLRRAPAEP
jgi:O-antigen/teichoic acid export membrane protein